MLARFSPGYLPLDCGNAVKALPANLAEATGFLSFAINPATKANAASVNYQCLRRGCRARAMSMLGNPLAEEPLCAHQPIKLRTGK